MRYGEKRWPEKNQCRKVQYHGKRFGAQVDMSRMFHSASWNHVFVSFAFLPLEYKIYCRIEFTTSEEAECVKREMDKALAFAEWLRKFENELEENQE